jgi:predicted DNA-binding transcriptional regulator AlpA
MLLEESRRAGVAPTDNIIPALKTPEAAVYCGLAPATLEGLRSKGGGPRFIKYGRKAVRYLVRDLEAWIAQRARFSTSEEPLS